MKERIQTPARAFAPYAFHQEARSGKQGIIPGPVIAGHQTQCDEEHHLILVDHRTIRCTPDEYRLLSRLMTCYRQLVPVPELIAQFQDASHLDPALLQVARRKLTYVLSRLRLKLEATDFIIVWVVNMRYLLAERSDLWDPTHFSCETDEEHD